MALGQNRTCKVFGTKADSTSDKYPYMELRLINLHDNDCDDDHNDGDDNDNDVDNDDEDVAGAAADDIYIYYDVCLFVCNEKSSLPPWSFL